jgi:HEAT repeat protein
MRAAIHHLPGLIVCTCLVAATGCAATAESAGGLFARLSGKKSPEESLDIKTPDDRALELVELGKTAHKKSPEEQNRISAELAAEIRNEKDPAMRRHILRALAGYRTPLSFAILTAGLQDSDLEVRRVACESLAQHGGPQAVSELTRAATSDTDIDVRVAAIRALGATNDKAAVPPLVDALVDRDPAIQFRAHESLRAVSGRDFGDDVQAWREYAKTGNSNAAEVSFAERLKRSLF